MLIISVYHICNSRCDQLDQSVTNSFLLLPVPAASQEKPEPASPLLLLHAQARRQRGWQTWKRCVQVLLPAKRGSDFPRHLNWRGHGCGSELLGHLVCIRRRPIVQCEALLAWGERRERSAWPLPRGTVWQADVLRRRSSPRARGNILQRLRSADRGTWLLWEGAVDCSGPLHDDDGRTGFVELPF